MSDEVVALLQQDRTKVDAFLQTFADVNALQAAHVKDLSALFKYLPSALNGVNRSFEKRTGLIRFGLVNDMENHACDYHTPRRQPENRAEQKPPLKARCGGAGGGGGQSVLDGLTPSADAEGSQSPEPDTNGTGALTDLLDTGGLSATPSLPARMSNWSWTLFYLNSV